MPDRRRHIAAAVGGLVLVLAAGGCAAAAPAAPSAAASVAVPPPASAPRIEPAVATPGASPATGETAPQRPDVSIEPLGDGRYRVTVTDPAAKAWRVVARGVEELDRSSLAVEVEVGDVGYAMAAERTSAIGPTGTDSAEVRIGPKDRTPVCEPTLHACVVPDAVKTAGNPSNGTTIVVLALDPTVPVEVSAGVAGWPGEPFILGPWSDSEAVTLGG